MKISVKVVGDEPTLGDDVLHEVNRFYMKKQQGYIDVWWLFDDGGNLLIIFYYKSRYANINFGLL